MIPVPGALRAWPVLDISASATAGRAPLDIAFSSNVRGGDGAYRFPWSFGDGRTSSAANP
jgi:PKD repeat protein